MVIRLYEAEILVVCYHCGKTLSKSEAFYIKHWDVYYCEKDYLALMEGKPVRKPRGLK